MAGNTNLPLTSTGPAQVTTPSDAFAFGGRSWSPIMDWLGYSGGHEVSFESALQTATFLACADVLSRDISEMTFTLRREEEGNRSTIVKPREHHLAALLQVEANPRQSFRALLRQSAFHLALAMRSYIVHEEDVQGRATALHAVRPECVTRAYGGDGARVYYQLQRPSQWDRLRLAALPQSVPERQMTCILSRTWDGHRAVSNLAAGQRALAILRAMEEHQAEFYDGKAMPRGTIEGPQGARLDQEQFDRIQRDLQQAYDRMGRTGLPFLLEQGFKFQPLTQNAADGQFTESITARIGDICRLMRVPPHKIMSFDGLKYDNIEPIERIYVKDSLGPLVSDVEDAMSRTHLSREERLDGYRVRAARREAYRDDPKVAMDMARHELVNSAISVNEYRQATGRETLDGMDVFLVQANVRLVRQDGSVVVDVSGNAGSAESGDGQGSQDAQGQASLRMIRGGRA